MTVHRRRWLVAGLALVVTAGRALAQGCAMCANSFAPDDPVTRAMSASVIFLLLTPYALCTGVAGWLYFRFRRSGAPRRASVTALPWVRAGLDPVNTPEEE